MFWIAVVSVEAALQAVFAGTAYFLKFPPKPSPLLANFFDFNRASIIPEKDIFFLRLLIAVGILSFIILAAFFYKRAKVSERVKDFAGLHAFFLSAQAFFLFKHYVYRDPLWLKGFYVTLALSFLWIFFSPEILRWVRVLLNRLKDPQPLTRLQPWLIAMTLVGVVLVIWVPDVEGAVARMFFGEQFHHIDWFLMCPGWAFISGNILGMDTIARYGIGAPAITAQLAQSFGGSFNHVSAVTVMMVESMVYYGIWFHVLRLFFKNTAWAVVALILAVRLQFFNIETFPFVFTYPQLTPLRLFCDSLFFLFFILYVQTQQMRWLYVTAAISGFSIFYITGEGVYTTVTFYIFLALREFAAFKLPHWGFRPLTNRERVLVAALPIVMAVLCYWTVVGNHVFQAKFWANQFEFVRLYQVGNMASPMVNNLSFPLVLRGAIAFVLPVLYLLIFLWGVGRLIQKEFDRSVLIVAIAGLFMLIGFHYHAMVSNNMPAYLRCGPTLALVAIFAVQRLSQHWSLYRQRLLKAGLALLGVILTVTTHQFLLHPNIFHLSKNPMTHPAISQIPPGRSSYFNHLFLSYPEAFKLAINGLGQKNEVMPTEHDFPSDREMKAFYKQELAYKADAALIRELTPEKSKVALISSFEYSILAQANRRPFFYTFFLINSQPRHIRKFPVTVLYTRDNLKRETDRLDKDKPAYVFVEKTYFVSPISQTYFHDNEDFIELLRYVFSHYEPYKQGEFLVALKRK